MTSFQLFSQQLFSKTHQWVLRTEQADQVLIGISQHAEEALSDIVFVELPEVGKSFLAGEIIGSIESVKTASEIQAPISGSLLECNKILEEEPEKLNEAPLTTWIYRLQVDPKTLVEEETLLFDAKAYAHFLAAS